MMKKDFWDTIGWNNTTFIGHNSQLIRIFLMLVVIGIFGTSAHKLMLFSEADTESEHVSILNELTGIDSVSSPGYDAGKIWSIDGKEIAAICTGENGWGKYCALPGYNGILGSAGCGGAIFEWNDMLHSSVSPINRNMRCGNSIQTTLSSSGQEMAAASLAKYCTKDICDSAALCVMLRDGAILVAAGNNTCTEADYFDDDKQQYIHANYCAESYATGSVAKIFMARTLELNNSSLPEAYSVYDTSFVDVSYYDTPEGYRIHNHDYKNSSAYTEAHDDLFTRKVSLADALKYSSNTYFVRHMQALGGFNTAYIKLRETFGFSIPIQTESMRLEAISCDECRIPYYCFGQDFYCSPIRLCEAVNHALSGDAYTPFLVASVYLPDSTEIYHADPLPRSEYHFNVSNKDIVRDAMRQCFDYYNINPELIAPYRALAESGRFLTKSGTADTASGKTNATRIITVLDEEGRVTATACILIHNLKSGNNTINNNVLYKMLLDSLNATGVIDKE